jgi:hypothetical protein
MHLPASAMLLDHQAGLDGCGTAEVMRRSGHLTPWRRIRVARATPVPMGARGFESLGDDGRTSLEYLL